jgi:hypothetical protein
MNLKEAKASLSPGRLEFFKSSQVVIGGNEIVPPQTLNSKALPHY